MFDGCHCDLLRTTSELEQFQSSWNALWNEDGNSTPFQSPAWLLPWWRQFGQPGLAAVVLSRHTWPIAFLPFYAHHEPQQDISRLLLLGTGTTDYLDGVFSPDCKVEHVKFALECVLSMDGCNSMVALQLRKSSKLFKAMRREDRREVESFRSESCLRIRAVHLDAFPQEMRQSVRSDRNRAAHYGKLELELADEHSWKQAFDALIHLHAKRWQSVDQPGLLADHKVLAFHYEAIPLLLKQRMFRLQLLRLDGEPIAAAYSLVDPHDRRARTQYLYLITHSFEHAELHPGTLLLAAMMEQAAEEGVAWIDLLRGEESYKDLWHAEQEPTFGFAIRWRRNGSEAGLPGQLCA
ncbi:MAG: GNAT family N-acetyltransferase [Terracidiphilus sp.]